MLTLGLVIETSPRQAPEGDFMRAVDSRLTGPADVNIAPRHGQRLDIQGLRMVAVLSVFALITCVRPSGGFVGVDVFFVIFGL